MRRSAVTLRTSDTWFRRLSPLDAERRERIRSMVHARVEKWGWQDDHSMVMVHPIQRALVRRGVALNGHAIPDSVLLHGILHDYIRRFAIRCRKTYQPHVFLQKDLIRRDDTLKVMNYKWMAKAGTSAIESRSPKPDELPSVVLQLTPEEEQCIESFNFDTMIFPDKKVRTAFENFIENPPTRRKLLLRFICDNRHNQLIPRSFSAESKVVNQVGSRAFISKIQMRRQWSGVGSNKWVTLPRRNDMMTPARNGTIQHTTFTELYAAASTSTQAFRKKWFDNAVVVKSATSDEKDTIDVKNLHETLQVEEGLRKKLQTEFFSLPEVRSLFRHGDIDMLADTTNFPQTALKPLRPHHALGLYRAHVVDSRVNLVDDGLTSWELFERARGLRETHDLAFVKNRFTKLTPIQQQAFRFCFPSAPERYYSGQLALKAFTLFTFQSNGLFDMKLDTALIGVLPDPSSWLEETRKEERERNDHERPIIKEFQERCFYLKRKAAQEFVTLPEAVESRFELLGQMLSRPECIENALAAHANYFKDTRSQQMVQYIKENEKTMLVNFRLDTLYTMIHESMLREKQKLHKVPMLTQSASAGSNVLVRARGIATKEDVKVVKKRHQPKEIEWAAPHPRGRGV